jgi:hypothetical protein
MGADDCARPAEGADLTWCQMLGPTGGMRRIEWSEPCCMVPGDWRASEGRVRGRVR